MTKKTNQRSPEDRFLEHEEFCLRVGRFVLKWPLLEWTLVLLIAEYGGMPQLVARAVLSGQRAKDLGSRLKSIGINKGLNKTARFVHLNYVITQMEALNTVRNELCHSIEVDFVDTQGKPGKLLTDSIRTTEVQKGKYVRYTLQTLSDVYIDTCRVHGLLGHHLHSAKDVEFVPPIEDAQHATWQYKPSEPEKTALQLLHTTRSSTRPP